LTAERPRLFFPRRSRGQGSCLALTPFSTGARGLGVISLLRLRFSWFGDRVHRDLLLPIVVPLVCAPVKVSSVWFSVQPFVVRSSVFLLPVRDGSCLCTPSARQNTCEQLCHS
jgi:hypothetical protein